MKTADHAELVNTNSGIHTNLQTHKENHQQVKSPMQKRALFLAKLIILSLSLFGLVFLATPILPGQVLEQLHPSRWGVEYRVLFESYTGLQILMVVSFLIYFSMIKRY